MGIEDDGAGGFPQRWSGGRHVLQCGIRGRRVRTARRGTHQYRCRRTPERGRVYADTCPARRVDPPLGRRVARQYTSFRLAEHLDAAGIAASIGSVGDAYDNALMESTIGLFKTELIKPRRPLKSLSQVELASAEWVDWYNHRRLHGEIGHVPTVEYEANHYKESTKPQVTTII
nr:integrase core domain-containing protein [Streptomyces sp. S3(2020)]